MQKNVNNVPRDTLTSLLLRVDRIGLIRLIAFPGIAKQGITGNPDW